MSDNAYAGVNAHLNSSLQAAGTPDQPAIWPGFHGQHVTNITEALNAFLPSHYYAISEQSFQIRALDVLGEAETRRPKPDVSVFHRDYELTGAASAAGGIAGTATLIPTWEAALAEVIDPTDQPRAVVIRELVPQHKLGRVVARIELLSPSNKPGGSNYESYAVKRANAIAEGIPLIEIDYLHEDPPVIVQMPMYPHDADAYPYAIIVSDPRPEWMRGRVQVYGFSVDEPIKRFPLPLSNDKALVFDLNPVYQHTFQAGRWGDILVDYRGEPERFHTYSATDQNKIRAVMARALSPQS